MQAYSSKNLGTHVQPCDHHQSRSRKVCWRLTTPPCSCNQPSLSAASGYDGLVFYSSRFAFPECHTCGIIQGITDIFRGKLQFSQWPYGKQRTLNRRILIITCKRMPSTLSQFFLLNGGGIQSLLNVSNLFIQMQDSGDQFQKLIYSLLYLPRQIVLAM